MNKRVLLKSMGLKAQDTTIQLAYRKLTKQRTEKGGRWNWWSSKSARANRKRSTEIINELTTRIIANPTIYSSSFRIAVAVQTCLTEVAESEHERNFVDISDSLRRLFPQFAIDEELFYPLYLAASSWSNDVEAWCDSVIGDTFKADFDPTPPAEPKAKKEVKHASKTRRKKSSR